MTALAVFFGALLGTLCGFWLAQRKPRRSEVTVKLEAPKCDELDELELWQLRGIAAEEGVTVPPQPRRADLIPLIRRARRAEL